MKVIQTVPGIADEAAGPSYSVTRLCGALVDAGADVELDAIAAKQDARRKYKVNVYDRNNFPMASLGRSKAMLSALKGQCQAADIVHANGMWMFPVIYPAWAKKGTRCKFVLSPRGSLAPWAMALGKGKKWVFGKLFQNAVLKAADMFHATSEKEYEEIRSYGLRQPVVILPIGMDLPSVSHVQSGETKTLAFFGRIHKVKSVDLLVRAWAKVADTHPTWQVKIAGPDCGDLDRVKGIVAAEKIPRVSFADEINGKAKYDFLASVDLYCLPSETENFGVTLAEALACHTPAIATRGTPWGGLVANNCGCWVEHTTEALSKSFDQMMSLSNEERSAMGKNGAAWIERDFSWPAIGRSMLDAYRWLANGGEVPSCVRVR